MLNKIFISGIALALALLGSCDTRTIPEYKIKSTFKNSANLNDTSAFLAGTRLSEGSPLRKLVQNEQYEKYRAEMDKIWDNYRTNNLIKIEAWRKAHLKNACRGTLMYPFSGPDILNALAFFPDADEYVMIGLEVPGSVPDPLRYQGPNIYQELFKIKKSLRTILQLNYFRTLEMMADFKSDSYSNITGIMMFFLARSGYEILDIKDFHIDQTGAIAYGKINPELKVTKGVEFIFRKGKGAPVQTAHFFSANLSDSAFSSLKGLSLHLGARKKFTTFIKSASYLLSFDNFKIMRSYLLAGSAYMVQEDSGIPYRYFSKEEWKISLYGRYRVLAMFSNRFQRDLDAEMKKSSYGMLPFSFGYGFVPEKSNLMIAERIQRSANR